MGQEPDPSRMPLDSSEFPEEVQVAFFMFSLLSDKWDGSSGSYMGKDWSQCSQLFEIYEIDNKKDTLFFMKMYEAVPLVNTQSGRSKRKNVSKSERKSQHRR